MGVDERYKNTLHDVKEDWILLNVLAKDLIRWCIYLRAEQLDKARNNIKTEKYRTRMKRIQGLRDRYGYEKELALVGLGKHLGNYEK